MSDHSSQALHTSVDSDSHGSSVSSSDAKAQAIKNLFVGFLVFFGVAVNVALSYAPLGSRSAHLVVGLGIAFLEVLLVAFVSMHLKTEKPLVVQAIIITVVFLVALVALSLLAFFDRIHI